MMVCSWEGNRRSDVSLAVRHMLSSVLSKLRDPLNYPQLYSRTKTYRPLCSAHSTPWPTIKNSTVLFMVYAVVCVYNIIIYRYMVLWFFIARHSYASAVLGVVILCVRLSVCPSVRHTRALWLIQRTYRRYFYTTWKGNPSSQMWFFVQLCSSWKDFNWLKASRGPSAIAELLVYFSYWVTFVLYIISYVLFNYFHYCHSVFSERELTFTFAICYRPSVCLSSVCLSSVCRL